MPTTGGTHLAAEQAARLCGEHDARAAGVLVLVPRVVQHCLAQHLQAGGWQRRRGRPDACSLLEVCGRAVCCGWQLQAGRWSCVSADTRSGITALTSSCWASSSVRSVMMRRHTTLPCVSAASKKRRMWLPLRAYSMCRVRRFLDMPTYTVCLQFAAAAGINLLMGRLHVGQSRAVQRRQPRQVRDLAGGSPGLAASLSVGCERAGDRKLVDAGLRGGAGGEFAGPSVGKRSPVAFLPPNERPPAAVSPLAAVLPAGRLCAPLRVRPNHSRRPLA